MPLQPAGGFLGIRARIDRFPPEIDAAVEQAFAGAVTNGELDRPDAARDAGDKHPFGAALAEKLETALEPAGAAGQHDDRIGAARVARIRQQHGEDRVAER